MKKGTIKNIDPNGVWNGLTKYKVTFADGNQYTFFSKGDFKFKVGDRLRYEVTNDEYKNAKIPKDQYEIKAPTEVIYKNTDQSTQKIKETCILASASFNAQRLSDIDTVINDAQLMFNFITK